MTFSERPLKPLPSAGCTCSLTTNRPTPLRFGLRTARPSLMAAAPPPIWRLWWYTRMTTRPPRLAGVTCTTSRLRVKGTTGVACDVVTLGRTVSVTGALTLPSPTRVAVTTPPRRGVNVTVNSPAAFVVAVAISAPSSASDTCCPATAGSTVPAITVSLP
jgi:hypothetical protein